MTAVRANAIDQEYSWEKLHEFISKHEGLTQSEIREQIGMSTKACSNRLEYLKTVKNVVRLDDDGKFWIEHDPHPQPRKSHYKPRKKVPRTKAPVVREVEIQPVTLGNTEFHELGDLNVNDIVETLVQLRWPKTIPTEKFPIILEWRDQTERLLS